MLTYLIESHRAAHNRFEALRLAVFDYQACLTSDGFLGKDDQALYEFPEDGIIEAGGILACPSFPPSRLEPADPARNTHEKIIAKREALKLLCDEIIVRFGDVCHSQDDHYCRHETWRGLILMPSYPMEVSPLVCAECDGIIARYRLPVSQELAQDIWSWDQDINLVERCWTACGVLEAWADAERHHPKGRVNSFGRSIARRIKAETGIGDWAYMPSRESFPEYTCPECEDELSALDYSRRYVRCERCGIAGIAI